MLRCAICGYIQAGAAGILNAAGTERHPSDGRARNNVRESSVKLMLNLPNNGYKIYEVQLYNEQVREMTQRRKRHSFFDRLWATPQVRDVVARDEAEAWALITERFPPEDGFVVERISTSRC